MRLPFPRVAFCAALFLGGAFCLRARVSPVQAQASALESLVAASSRVLRLENGSLQGPGAEFLLAEAARAQFVALGEEHNTLEIPGFLVALFRILNGKHGFSFLAVEQDPATGRLVSTPPARGRKDSIAALARRYPHAFTFISDQELEMLAAVGEISRTAANPVWGCDQAFGATHILDRLLTTAEAPGTRRFVQQLRDAAQEKERTRALSKYHYMSNEPKSEKFGELRQRLRPKARSEAEMFVEALVVSDRIYRNYREGAYYENAREREEYMKRRFLDEYRLAQGAEKKAPRVVLKFGHWHLFRGLGPNNQQTLGNFVSEFALANNARSFHLAVFPHNPPGGYGSLAKWPDRAPQLLAAGVKTSEWTLVDLRPLRSHYSRLVKEVAPDLRDALRRWIFGYDAALFMGGIRRATFELNPGVEY